jgi:hypothetical protein
MTKDEAHAHFDWMADLVEINNPLSSAVTRKTGLFSALENAARLALVSPDDVLRQVVF